MCVAVAARHLRCLAGDRAPAVDRVDESGAVASSAPGGPGRAGRPGRDRLDPGHRGRRPCAGEKRGAPTGPNPVDRGKKGSRQHVLSEAQGISPGVAVFGANTHDSQALKALVRAIPTVPSHRGPHRRRPGKLRADKAYFSAGHLAWLRERGIAPRIARPGIETSERPDHHRWKIEGSIARLFGYHRLTVRYERKGSHFLAFPGLAAALTCYEKPAKLATRDNLQVRDPAAVRRRRDEVAVDRIRCPLDGVVRNRSDHSPAPDCAGDAEVGLMDLGDQLLEEGVPHPPGRGRPRASSPRNTWRGRSSSRTR
ncbi:transposase [Streptomyces sp. NPDC056529]|uniref:transposase n=1 Tax=Streptomyces sp. NPDC056529 TaxID=3345855 RepID=UPI0036D188EA